MSVLVVLQSTDGEWNRVSFEALAAGMQIADAYELPLAAAVIGSGIKDLALQAASYDVSQVYSLDHPLLREYTQEAFTSALQQLIEHCSPLTVVFPHTYQVRDYAPRLAARFGSALISDVISIKSEGYPMYFVRQLYLGKFHADVYTTSTPAFVSVQASAFRPLEPVAGKEGNTGATMEEVVIHIDESKIFSKPEAPIRGNQNTVDLRGAKSIVSIGRGLKKQEDLALVQELAQVLRAELAASRPICDNGWVPMDRLVGSSGQTVSPDVYFAIGISGSIQHLLGMKGSKTVVAVNKDEAAPIFDIAQYGIVGDLAVVVPALVDELRKSKS